MLESEYVQGVGKFLTKAQMLKVSAGVVSQLESKKASFIAIKGRNVHDIKKKFQEMMMVIIIRKVQTVLDECKKDVKASIEEVKTEEDKRNKWWENLTAKQEIANAKIQKTQVAMSEYLEILATALGQLDPVDDDHEEENDLGDVL